jgi:thiamine biosynthesis lipoprotein
MPITFPRRTYLPRLGLCALAAFGACARNHERPAQGAEDAGSASAKAELSASAADAASAAADGQSPAPTPMHAASREIMSTWFEVKVLSAKPPEAVQADLSAALDEIARLETLLSEWVPSTEISRINARAGKEGVSVGPDTWAVVSRGQAIAEQSQGAFDMTWAALRGLYRFGPDDPKRIPTKAEIVPKLALVGYRDVLLDPEKQTVKLKRKGMALGTGGIAKGYALDRVEALLLERGYPNFLLFAGGQVQLHGSRDGRAWRIGIRHPRKLDQHIAAFEVFDGSVSTSGDYEHSFEVDGQRVHHIIDLSTGRPGTRSASVTLIARSGIDADALSTACFIKGPEACLAFLAKLDEPADAVIIAPDLSVHMSPGIASRVRFDPPLVDGRLAQ